MHFAKPTRLKNYYQEEMQGLKLLVFVCTSNSHNIPRLFRKQQKSYMYFESQNTPGP